MGSEETIPKLSELIIIVFLGFRKDSNMLIKQNK